MKPERQLSTVPEGQRLGLLTHPTWLVSHSDAMDNHAIRRGRWVRERLLGGGIPDVPITVDAMLPDEPGTSLRHRMRVTREEYCWTCHKKMDPLGLPFEIYNHAGLYRTTEGGESVDATGEIIESGDSSLDGEVKDAIEMIQRLSDSEPGLSKSLFGTRSAFGWDVTKQFMIAMYFRMLTAPTAKVEWRKYEGFAYLSPHFGCISISNQGI